jgi:hypothetical protein
MREARCEVCNLSLGCFLEKGDPPVLCFKCTSAKAAGDPNRYAWMKQAK